MPSRGIQSLRKYGRQRTSAAISGRRASAFSSRRLPMKHHGQTTSETTSIGIGIGGECGVDMTIPRLLERKLSFASISCNQVLDGARSAQNDDGDRPAQLIRLSLRD